MADALKKWAGNRRVTVQKLDQFVLLSARKSKIGVSNNANDLRMALGILLRTFCNIGDRFGFAESHQVFGAFAAIESAALHK